MMIFIGADYNELGLSPEEIQGQMGKWFAWNQKMQAQGIVESGEALMPSVTHVSGSEKTIKDNVAVESKELVGGYYVFKAENLEEAKKVVMDYPDYDLGGTVELREVMVFDNV